jgi:hypothetical protein
LKTKKTKRREIVRTEGAFMAQNYRRLAGGYIPDARDAPSSPLKEPKPMKPQTTTLTPFKGQ